MKYPIVAGLTVFLFSSGIAGAQTFEQGFAAYSEGDYVAAREIWLPLAEEGHLLAQFNLGIIFSLGRGISRDNAVAAQWFERAAEQGDPVAAYNLGLFYSEGRGVEQDDETAVHWLRLGADQGHVGALSQLANHYALGRGVVQDISRALELGEIARETECLLDDMSQNHQARMSLIPLRSVGG